MCLAQLDRILAGSASGVWRLGGKKESERERQRACDDGWNEMERQRQRRTKEGDAGQGGGPWEGLSHVVVSGCVCVLCVCVRVCLGDGWVEPIGKGRLL